MNHDAIAEACDSSDASLRVAVVTSRLDIGGTERHLARILPALKQRGLHVALYVMERGGPLEAEIAAQGVRIEGPRRVRFLHWARATLALALWLRRERPALIHFFLPRPYIFGSLAAELAGHRRRIMSRRSLTDYRKRYPLLGLLERLLHRRTLGMLGNSQAVLDQLAAEVGDRRKLAIIHNCIVPPPPASDRCRYGLSQACADHRPPRRADRGQPASCRACRACGDAAVAQASPGADIFFDNR